MIKILPAVILFSFSVFLSGCGGDTVAVDDPHEDYVPELYAFDIVDSYNTDTATPQHQALAFNPYINDGRYKIFWDVNSLEDYRVSLRINDRETINGSLLIHSQWCGAGRSCDQSGNWTCEYTNDFYMSCDGFVHEKDIYPLIDQVPQKVYMFIEVCDSNSGYCEYDYYPVTLE